MRRLLIIIGASLWLFGCVATPLPHPPTLDADLVTVTEVAGGEVLLEGEAGAISPGSLEVRITWAPGPTSVGEPVAGELMTAPDGSFSTVTHGLRDDLYFFEAVTEEEDLFLGAVTGGPGDAVELIPTSDRDGDGSPDEVDCAPDDESVGGQRCD